MATGSEEAVVDDWLVLFVKVLNVSKKMETLNG
jgi:hypothetical protein